MIPLSAILDHLWQSTLLALAIGLLVLALRKAPAAVRHGLWLAASIKFLIPFAALAALGRLLAPAGLVPAPAAPQAALIAKAAQPLSRFPFEPSSRLLQAPLVQAPLSPAEPGPSVAQALHQVGLHVDLGLILLIVWVLGAAMVLGRWMIRSARVHRVVRASIPLAWPAPMPIVASPSQMGPGLVGLWRPVLVMPRSLPEHLTRSEIDAILAHEACHLRRRDNLTAALHALIEAVFWFHPLVWWIGIRMIAEREHACDEQVVREGHDRRTYARCLVESARLYVQSPLSCVASAAGIDLKTRVERIMTAPLASPLSRSKKALLLAAASFAFATPVAAGLMTPEGRKVIAPLGRAMAVMAAPAHALGVDQAAQAEAPKPVVLARNDALIGPRIAVAAADAAPLALGQTFAPPHVDPAPAQAARPFEVATASPAAPARPVAPAVAPADPSESAAGFVRAYAAATAKRQVIARWLNPICVGVFGLTSDPAAAVKARVEAVAKGVGIRLQPTGCKRPDIEIGFTTEPQATLDGVIKTNDRLLGDPTSGTKSAKTVTLPIQAWYQTNGRELAANNVGSLKALADYRAEGWGRLKTPVLYQGCGPGQSTCPSTMGADYGVGCCSGSPQQEPIGGWPDEEPRQFQNVLMIVDLKRTGGMTLGLISDYATMLALAQPKSLGDCQALPSITDLFAACPGRGAPEGLTLADTAYLHALYAADHQQRGAYVNNPALLADVVDGMAPLLANAKVAAR